MACAFTIKRAVDIMRVLLVQHTKVAMDDIKGGSGLFRIVSFCQAGLYT